MEKANAYVRAVYKNGIFNVVSKDIWDTLVLPTEGMIYHKEDGEYVFFNDEKAKEFFAQMKKSLGMNPTQLMFTKEGNRYTGDLLAKSLAIAHIPEASYAIHIEPRTKIIKRIPEGECRIAMYI